MFYSSFQQWPATVQPNSTGTAGRSPLVWTMLHPPSATAQLQTYLWDRHLDSFMPWTASNPGCDTWPPLISHAMWNLQQGSKSPRQPQNGTDNSYGCSNQLPESLEQSTQQSALELQPNGLTLEKPPGSVLSAFKPISSAPFHMPHLLAPIRSISILKAMMVYLLLVQQSSNTGFVAQYVISLATWHWTNP